MYTSVDTFLINCVYKRNVVVEFRYILEMRGRAIGAVANILECTYPNMDYVYFIIIQPIPTYFESDMRLES